MTIDFQHLQCGLGGRQIDSSRSAHLGIVSHAPQKPVGNAWCPARTAGNFQRTGVVDLDSKNVRRTLYDDAQIFVSIELEPQDDAKARTQRRRKQSCARGRTDKSERLHIHGVSARGRALTNDDVEFVVLQRGVEDLLECGLQAVHLVNKKHLLVANVSQDGGEVAFDLQRGTGGLLGRHSQFVGNDGGQGSLAQPRRTVKQDVIQRLASRPRRLNRDGQVFFDFGLTDELRQPLRPQLQLERRIVFDGRRRHESLLQVWDVFGGGH